MQTLLITGGAGFIGSNLIELALSVGHRVVNLDALTYAGNLESLQGISNNPKYSFVHGDIRDSSLVNGVFERYSPTKVIHLAAESHVDRSIESPSDFISSNVMGTFVLLEGFRSFYLGLTDEEKQGARFIHVSTDEVFGSLGGNGFFSEHTPYSPRSPYSASKAASDHLVRSYFHTYSLPTIVTNCSNNYGPKQFPEKLIPLCIHKALELDSIPIYGDGSNVRDWLFVLDHCEALLTVLEHGVPGDTYVVGGNNEQSNLDVVTRLCYLLDKRVPREDGFSYSEQIVFVKDRPGHDYRYAIDSSKIRTQLGWVPKESFESGLSKTVNWYIENREWVVRVNSGVYRGERLGLIGRGGAHR